MKKNLIKTVIFFLLVQTQLAASSYEWRANINKTQAYVNEAVNLEYVCTFSDIAELYVIDFDPVTENEKYTLRLLNKNERIIDGKKVNSYEFVAFVHQAGEMRFNFDVSMKKTNRDSIENTVIGRDNGEYAEYTTTILKQKELVVNVLEDNSSLIGTLEMQVTKDTPKIKAYEPFHMEIKFSGKANFDNLKPFIFEIEGVKVFSQEPNVNVKLTKDGYEGVWSQKFAFVGTKDFVIPELRTEYFDLQSRAIKELAYEKTEVEVAPAFTKEELLDEEAEISLWHQEYLYYVLTFLAGFLLAKIKLTRTSKSLTDADVFAQKVQNAASLQALCVILALQDAKKYESLITKIETKELTSIKEAKKLISY
ncbi:BatD family protein [bacterium]|nr:BatD family protein [bacterium]MBU1435091.1 BatD family protein [bacterium]MBU1504196.1 BatD family protein [bacterium]